jgi:hypothetical protein
MMSYMNYLPAEFAYLRHWAEKFGVRGLTIYNSPVPYTKYASDRELPELQIAYETIATRGDLPSIIKWCHSIESRTPANDAREAVRGLLLLFERLAEYELSPFADGRVRYIYPKEEPYVFNWDRLPAQFRHLIPWLQKFEHLRTEMQVYDYAADANEAQRRELLELRALLARDSDAFVDWCTSNDNAAHSPKREIFQAEWMFLLLDFITWEKNADGTLRCPS